MYERARFQSQALHSFFPPLIINELNQFDFMFTNGYNSCVIVYGRYLGPSSMSYSREPTMIQQFPFIPKSKPNGRNTNANLHCDNKVLSLPTYSFSINISDLVRMDILLLL